jgi:hypothetical protein
MKISGRIKPLKICNTVKQNNPISLADVLKVQVFTLNSRLLREFMAVLRKLGTIKTATLRDYPNFVTTEGSLRF